MSITEAGQYVDLDAAGEQQTTVGQRRLCLIFECDVANAQQDDVNMTSK
jgi:hypothetical protein